MTVNNLIIPERAAKIGQFLVGRLLPFRRKRQVGPFTFIDHMGPAIIGPKKFVDIDQHPHIGLCTLTYLFEGAIEHKDSTGAVQVITAGDVGLMTSGKGVTHTERTPKNMRNKSFTMHGYQVWIALPTEKEQMQPRFDFQPKDNLPEWTEHELRYRVVAGEAFGRTSPVPVHSPLFMVDVLAKDNGVLNTSKGLSGELAIVVVNGSLEIEGRIIQQGEMLVSEACQCEIEVARGTQLLLFGGQPFPEERYLDWNFVSSSKQELKNARKRWESFKFDNVPNDNTYIEYPSNRK